MFHNKFIISFVGTNMIYKKHRYKGAFIYEDTCNRTGRVEITTNLHGTINFKTLRAAKVAITKWG